MVVELRETKDEKLYVGITVRDASGKIGVKLLLLLLLGTIEVEAAMTEREGRKWRTVAAAAWFSNSAILAFFVGMGALSSLSCSSISFSSDEGEGRRRLTKGRVSKIVSTVQRTLILGRLELPWRFSDDLTGLLCSSGLGDDGWLIHSVVVDDMDQSEPSEVGEQGVSIGLLIPYPSQAFSLMG